MIIIPCVVRTALCRISRVGTDREQVSDGRRSDRTARVACEYSQVSEDIFASVNGLIFVVLASGVIGCLAVWWLRWCIFRLDRALGEMSRDQRPLYVVPLMSAA